MAQLPSPGDSFDLDVSAEVTRIKQEGSTFGVDLSGDLTFEIREIEGAPSGRAVLVAVPRFRLTGRPGRSRDRGSTPRHVTVEQGDPDPDRQNLLRLTGDSRLDHVLALDLRVTFGQSREDEAAADDPDRDRDRRVLRTKEPAVFRSRPLDDFPPEGEEYRLLGPILLVDDDGDGRDDRDRGEVVAVIERFPLRVGDN